jgi:hypothetical protein
MLDLLWQEARAVLDEEVNRLPDRYRVAFVLCQIEGRTIKGAAQLLSCPPATVGTRLARARALLHRRLAHRGFNLTALIASQNAKAALPAALLDSTVRAALLGTATRAVAAGVISANVAFLTRGVLPTMSLTRWLFATALVLPLCLFGGGNAFVPHQAQAVEPGETHAQPTLSRLESPAEDRDPVVILKWKFEKDKPFYQELTTETKQTMSVMAKDIIQTQTQTFVFRWTPLGRDMDGNWVLTQKIEAVKMDIEIGGQKISFDSTKAGNTPTSLWDFYKTLVGAEFHVTLNQELTVQKVEGREALSAKIASTSPATVTLLPQLLSSYAMNQLTDTSFAVFHDKPVRKGDSWTTKTKLDMGQIGDYETRYKYIYEGQQDKRHRIKVKSTVEVQPGENDRRLRFKIEDKKLKGEGEGTIDFDSRRGCITCQELILRVEGQVTFNDGSTTANLRQWQKATVRTTDEDPTIRTSPKDDASAELERLRKENEQLRRQLRAVEEALQQTKPKD